MIIAILTLFVIYTVCCCLDAPEVKSKREQMILDWCYKKVAQSPFECVNTGVFETRYEPIVLSNRFIVTDYDKFVMGEEKAIELAEEASINALLQNILLYKNECIEITKDTDLVSGYTRIYSKIQVLTKQNNYK